MALRKSEIISRSRSCHMVLHTNKAIDNDLFDGIFSFPDLAYSLNDVDFLNETRPVFFEKIDLFKHGEQKGQKRKQNLMEINFVGPLSSLKSVPSVPS